MGRKPPVAGVNGTSPEIPFTVDADPYATAGKAAATARPGERGPASTGASAVGTQGRDARGTREIPPSPRGCPVDPTPTGNRRGGDRGWEVGSAHTTDEAGESLGEGRGRQTSASTARRMAGTQRPSPMSQSLRWLARKAKEEPQTQFTAIAHLLTEEVYWAAWRRLKKGASTGVDGVTATAYAADLGGNLRALQARVQAKQYRPQPVRRVPIPKDGGGTRPIGIPALEDKLVQGAVRLVLEAIYEQDFLPCSHGFRPGRSPHQALAALEQALVRQKVSYVLDIDIRRCFDSLGQAHLLRFVQHRVKDRSILRLLRQWLRAGVVEAGQVTAAATSVTCWRRTRYFSRARPCRIPGSMSTPRLYGAACATTRARLCWLRFLPSRPSFAPFSAVAIGRFMRPAVPPMWRDSSTSAAYQWSSAIVPWPMGIGGTSCNRYIPCPAPRA